MSRISSSGGESMRGIRAGTSVSRLASVKESRRNGSTHVRGKVVSISGERCVVSWRTGDEEEMSKRKALRLAGAFSPDTTKRAKAKRRPRRSVADDVAASDASSARAIDDVPPARPVAALTQTEAPPPAERPITRVTTAEPALVSEDAAPPADLAVGDAAPPAERATGDAAPPAEPELTDAALPAERASDDAASRAEPTFVSEDAAPALASDETATPAVNPEHNDEAEDAAPPDSLPPARAREEPTPDQARLVSPQREDDHSHYTVVKALSSTPRRRRSLSLPPSTTTSRRNDESPLGTPTGGERRKPLDKLRNRKCEPGIKISWHGGKGYGGVSGSWVEVATGHFRNVADLYIENSPPLDGDHLLSQ